MSSLSAPLFADRRAREADLRQEPRLERRGPEQTRTTSTRTALSGLTPDEQRVHRLLLNALERENSRTGVADGLTYAEKKRVAESLDLAYSQKELDHMEAVRRYEDPPSVMESSANWKFKTFAALLSLMLPSAIWHAFADQTIGSLLPVVLSGLALYGLVRSFGERERLARPSTRQKIYADLHELAVALDLSNAADSPSIRRADALIDSFSARDEVPVPGTRLANR